MPLARPAASRLETLLRRASSPVALLALLRRLGLGYEYCLVSRLALARAGLRPSVTRRVQCGGSSVPCYVCELAGEAGPELIRRVVRSLAALSDGPFLFIFSLPRARTLVFGCRAADGAVRFAPVDRLHPRPAELVLLEELAGGPAGELARLLHWTRILDRSSVGARFFRDIRSHRDAIARAWTGIPATATPERERLALLLLCRLLFLCFLQERGHLLGDRGFLASLVRSGRGRTEGSLYDVVLRPLFFAVFNTRPEQRPGAAAALGPLPYLNGGLFEPHPLERRFPELGLPNDALLRTFSDLLDRYRFSTDDAAEAAAAGMFRSGVDPEVLGRVFEALMAAPQRTRTGSYYTPPAAVDGLVARVLAHALAGVGGIGLSDAERLVAGEHGHSLPPAARRAVRDRLRDLRVLDPACGSGAFLLGALSRITRVLGTLEPESDLGTIRQDVVSRTLHGVDLLDDAALLCALRLWLALAPRRGESVAPLPNLDRRIRQGDALLDPLDLLTPELRPGPDRGAALDSEVRRVLHEIGSLGDAYLGAEPVERAGLRTRIQVAERRLARIWLSALRSRIERALREARALAEGVDLWGEPAGRPAAVRERGRLRHRLAQLDVLLHELEQARALPFFSFAVHFAAESAGFDLVIGNPPWVRAHRWPVSLAGAVRSRFRVCRQAGWPGLRKLAPNGGGAGGQVDLALLFLERGLSLLRDGGTLAMLLPAKLLRSLFAGGARAMLLQDAALLELDDHGLDQHSVFQADSFTVQVLARRAPVSGPVRITLRNRGREPLRFDLNPRDLPLIADDLQAPWLLAPPEAMEALRHMQRAGRPIGNTVGLRLRRGVVTGANDVLVVPAAEHRLGGLSHIRAQGWFRARRVGDGTGAAAFAGWIETECLRPLLRGADVKAWRWSSPQQVIWVPANDRPGTATPPRTARYLARHASLLERRAGGGRGNGRGCVLHAGDELAGDKVVWQDIAEDLHAAAVPARAHTLAGRKLPVVPLNTVYYLGVADAATAGVVAALLNSLPLRVFARAVAERAKDARFRFFAWTVAALPLPRPWQTPSLARELADLAGTAQQAGGLDAAGQRQLDLRVAAAFGLSDTQYQALAAFDSWLKR